MKKTVAAIMLAVSLAACGSTATPGDVDMPEYNSEGLQACYTQSGKFYEYDDDCHDDGRITYREMLARRATSPKATPVRTDKPVSSGGPYRPRVTKRT